MADTRATLGIGKRNKNTHNVGDVECEETLKELQTSATAIRRKKVKLVEKIKANGVGARAYGKRWC